MQVKSSPKKQFKVWLVIEDNASRELLRCTPVHM